MTKFVFKNDTFLVGVQPNAVPEGNTDNSDTSKDIEVLKEENKKLKDEIERLKSLLNNTT